MQFLLKQLLQARLVSLNIGTYRFSPGIVPSITTLAFVYLMVFMAQWQAGKAEYKDDLRDKIVARKNLPIISMQELPVSVEDRRFLPVRIEGQFNTQHSFLLDNKILNGRVGYDVYTPLTMSNGKAILVNRGFLPLGRTRQELPPFETPAGTIMLKGLIDKVPSKTIVLADDVNQVKSWPVVLQYIDAKEIEQVLGYSLYDMVLWLDKEESYGFTRTLPALNFDSAKNAGYAFQWYALTLTLIIIYIVVNTKQRDDTND